MSIDINNANFKIFTDFAATAKQSARAHLESKAELKEQLGPETTSHYDADGVFDSFLADGGRDEYKIGDQVFPGGGGHPPNCASTSTGQWN